MEVLSKIEQTQIKVGAAAEIFEMALDFLDSNAEGTAQELSLASYFFGTQLPRCALVLNTVLGMIKDAQKEIGEAIAWAYREEQAAVEDGAAREVAGC